MKVQPQYEVRRNQDDEIVASGSGSFDQMDTYVKALAQLGLRLIPRRRSHEERSANWRGHRIHIHLRSPNNEPFGTIGFVAGLDLAITGTICLPGDQFSRETARERIGYQFKSSSLSTAIDEDVLRNMLLETDRKSLARQLCSFITSRTRINLENMLSEAVRHSIRPRLGDNTPMIIGERMLHWLSVNDGALTGLSHAALMLYTEACDAEAKF